MSQKIEKHINKKIMKGETLEQPICGNCSKEIPNYGWCEKCLNTKKMTVPLRIRPKCTIL